GIRIAYDKIHGQTAHHIDAQLRIEPATDGFTQIGGDELVASCQAQSLLKPVPENVVGAPVKDDVIVEKATLATHFIAPQIVRFITQGRGAKTVAGQIGCAIKPRLWLCITGRSPRTVTFGD